MDETQQPKEPPVLLIVIGVLLIVGLVVWGVGAFFKLDSIKDWMTEQLGGWALPVGIFLPGFIIGWILKKVLDS